MKNDLKSNFLSFTKLIWRDFIEGSHHKEISEKFNLLSHEKIKRLIINIPTRHSKSSLTSFLLPVWMIGNKSDLKITIISENIDLATRYFNKVNKLIQSPSYKKIFKTNFKKNINNNKLETEQGGYCYFTSVDSQTFYNDEDLLIIDDPQSTETNLNNISKIYSFLVDKLNTKCSIVLVMTRISKDDLTGKLLQTKVETKNKWVVLKLPAIQSNEKPLWPDFWTLDELKKIKESISKQEWNLKWMQNE